MREKIVAGNWKMYKTLSETKEFAKEFLKVYQNKEDVKVVICPPFTQIPALKEAFTNSSIMIGAQNVSAEDEGAFTGEVSIPMLEELGVDFAIVGHSERRKYFNEEDDDINYKVLKLLNSKIRPILCVGEDIHQRNSGLAFSTVENQIKKDLADVSKELASKLVIAYEPIWAIGTGETATPNQAEEMCSFIRTTLVSLFGENVASRIVIQYGGSVKPDNAGELFRQENIDGGLVGGASLKPNDFNIIVNS